MTDQNPSRRDFHLLTAAAFGGLAAGAVAGCGGGDAPETTAAAASEKHLCRGLNECKGHGGGGENACRGQGACATYDKHDCGGKNACKGQGGCGANPGENACKGQGGCAVPLMDDAWATLRAKKEKQWKETLRNFGSAPEKKKS